MKDRILTKTGIAKISMRKSTYILRRPVTTVIDVPDSISVCNKDIITSVADTGEVHYVKWSGSVESYEFEIDIGMSEYDSNQFVIFSKVGDYFVGEDTFDKTQVREYLDTHIVYVEDFIKKLNLLHS